MTETFELNDARMRSSEAFAVSTQLLVQSGDADAG